MNARFWSKVEKTDGCWLWTGSKNLNGYGTYGRRLAHRASYEELVGPIAEGLTIDHLCRVRNCVNPAHLEPVTMKTNLMRGEGFSARNARKTHCPKGHEYTEENTTYRGGSRFCRTCKRESDRQLRQKYRERYNAYLREYKRRCRREAALSPTSSAESSE